MHSAGRRLSFVGTFCSENVFCKECLVCLSLCRLLYYSCFPIKRFPGAWGHQTYKRYPRGSEGPRGSGRSCLQPPRLSGYIHAVRTGTGSKYFFPRALVLTWQFSWLIERRSFPHGSEASGDRCLLAWKSRGERSC